MRAKGLPEISNGVCDGCGLPVDECGPVCESMRDELLARDFEQAAYWRFHRMAVDAYCLSTRSVIASRRSPWRRICAACASPLR